MDSKHRLHIEENVSLAPLTTLGIGGPARHFTKAVTELGVVEAFEFAAKRSIELFVLGGGSNILVSDTGFDGLVLYTALRGITEQTQATSLPDDVFNIAANAGEDWDNFVAYCVGRNLAGIECLSGIPGFIGGTPIQNVGAYGQEVSETIVSVRCFDRKNSLIVELTNADCGFSYRQSIFNSTNRDRYIVLSVTFALNANGRPKITYRDLRERFGDHIPSLAETRNAVVSIRRSKSMVIDPHDPNSKSAGSFFKNPIVPNSVTDRIAAKMGIERVPQFPVDESHVKIPAAWLIENAGFHKGYRLGNAGISANHSLALVNFGNATAFEIIALKEAIQNEVSERFEIMLLPEPIFVGF